MNDVKLGFGIGGVKLFKGMPDGTHAERVYSVSGAVDADGNSFSPDILARTLNYTGDNLTSISATDGTNIWVQTLSYTNGKLTGISTWVKQ